MKLKDIEERAKQLHESRRKAMSTHDNSVAYDTTISMSRDEGLIQGSAVASFETPLAHQVNPETIK